MTAFRSIFRRVSVLLHSSPETVGMGLSLDVGRVAWVNRVRVKEDMLYRKLGYLIGRVD